jgi:hypothetical protein
LYFAEENAQIHPEQRKKPFIRIVTLSKMDTWMVFDAWRYRHWWEGNHMVIRYHAFFRSIRQTPTSSNIIRKGKRLNYIKLDSHNQLLELNCGYDVLGEVKQEDYDEVIFDELEPNYVDSNFEACGLGYQTAVI